jgi:DNA-binding FadR family transcriptional regulator
LERVLAREGKLGDRVYGLIVERISRGDYPPQSRLPSEALLAREFRVSRPVVREALARLREDELIRSRRGSGSWVQRTPPRTVLNLAPIGSLADVQRCFEFRVSLEGEAAALAAERRNDDDLAAITAAFEQLERVIEAGELGADADYAFHRAIAKATANRYFVDVLDLLRAHIDAGMQITRTLSLQRPTARLRLVQDEHAAILAAVQKGRGRLAREAMRAHIGNARRRMFEGDQAGAA